MEEEETVKEKEEEEEKGWEHTWEEEATKGGSGDDISIEREQRACKKSPNFYFRIF